MLASTRPQAIAYLLVPRADASGECGGPGGHIAPEPVFPAKYESAEHADGFAVEFTSTRLERPNRSQVSMPPCATPVDVTYGEPMEADDHHPF